MTSRPIASGVSVVLSLGLMAVVVLAFVAKPPRQQHIDPVAVPSSDQKPAVSVLAQPEALTALPVVLPPPPAPARDPKAEATGLKAAPQLAETGQKSPPAKKSQSKAPSPPSSAIGADSKAPQPREPKSKPVAGRKPPRRSAQKARERSPPSERPSLTAKAATVEKPGKSIVASQGDLAEGRTLLRLLEHGSGPTIELAWPDSVEHRESLFALFSQCYGMRVALMDAEDRLYVADGRPNAPWNLSLDRYSGFIREPAGELSRQERQATERVRKHHGGLAPTSPVRVFPRAVDARLLGGLRRLVGESYATVQTIRARYRLNGRRLVVEQIVADGRRVSGQLELLPVAGGACRRLVQR